MSRSVMMQGTGVSSSLTSAAPIPLRGHLRRGLAQGVRRADRQDHLGHAFPYLHRALSSVGREFVRIVSSLPERRAHANRFHGRPGI